MTDQDLSELMERLGDRTPVGRPPTAAMLESAARRRRRTGWSVAGAAAAAVLATVGGVAVLGGGHDDRQGTDRGDEPGGYVAEPGTRLVGIGHLAVAVPEEWGTNATECGTPQEDTVVVDQGAICLALVPRPAGVESIELFPGWYGGFGEPGDVETTEVAVDGRAARRVATTCGPAHGQRGDVEVCRGALWFPEEKVTVLADSSSADARQQVDEMLGWTRWVEDLVAVPGYQTIDLEQQDDDAAGHYRREAEALGLSVRTVAEKRPGMPAGYVLDVDPGPGTMLEPGSTVTVTVAGG